MYYVLNFNNHRFVTADSPSQAIEFAKIAIEDCSVSEDEIEFIDANGEKTRFDFASFVKEWS